MASTASMLIPPPMPSSISGSFAWSPPAPPPQDPAIAKTTQRIYNIEFTRGEDGWIVVRCPDLPGLNTQGRSEKEAVTNTIEAVELYEEELGLESDKEFNLIIRYR